MKKFTVRPATPRTLRIACATVLAVALGSTLPQQAYAQRETPPPVPDPIRVSAGHRLFLAGHAFGTQNYICLPSGAGFAWTLFGPQATLFHNDARQVMTHFLSPNPDEAGTLRRRGSTPSMRARCGQGQSPRPLISASLHRARSHGSCSKWWERRADRQEAEG